MTIIHAHLLKTSSDITEKALISKFLMPDVTMVTFTYNDHILVDELLASMVNWTLQPQRIIVVDDGSTERYINEKANVIRLTQNQGFSKAKHAGISSVTGKFILSLDCDIRLNNDWLYKNIYHAACKNIGIVTSGIVHKFNDTIVDRYIKFYLNYPATGYTKILNNGGAWLFRKTVWDMAGGFSAFSGLLSEDIWFSQEVYKRGYNLFSNEAVQAFEARRFNRFSAVIRIWKGQWKTFREQLNVQSPFQETLSYLLATFKLRTQNKLYIPEFAYIDILLFTYATIDTLKKINKYHYKNLYGHIFLQTLLSLISKYPIISSTILSDILKLSKIDKSQLNENSFYPLEVYCSEFLSFFSKSLFMDIEKNYLPKILEEHSIVNSNYSSYGQI